MKPNSKLFIAGLAGLAGLALPSYAAEVTWGPVTPITAATNIDTAGMTSIAGANFGITTGTTTTVLAAETGTVNVEFKSLRSGQSAALANGITVAANNQWGNWGSAGGNSAVTGDFGIVLDSNLGIEAAPGASATITLSGLTIGTPYRIQFFADSTGTNSQTISGSAAINSLSGQFVTGTFTADADSQVLTVTQTVDFAVANALTVGPLMVTDTTAPTISGLNPADDATDVAVGANLVATFDEAITLGSGDITIKNLTDATETTLTLPDGQVSVAGAVLTINPAVDLATSKNYAVRIAATAVKDAADNAFAGIADDTTWNFTTAAPDVTAPVWTATWPQAEQLSPTSIRVRAQTNEAGTAYYVVLADGAAAPTAAQVKAGTDSSDVPAPQFGSMVLSAHVEATATAAGLATDSTYNVYVVAEDGVPNLQSAPAMVSVALSSAGVVTWGEWTAVTDNTAIQTLGGYTTYGGVNFNGSATTISNGSVDVSFAGTTTSGSSGNIAVSSANTAGITVGFSGFDFQSTGNNSNVATAVGAPVTWATVLDRVIGDFGSGDAATITLGGLTVGSSYYVQFFSSAPDENILGNSKITSEEVDSPFFGAHPNGGTKSIIGTFTATSTSRSFTISGTEPTYSALVIGVQPAGGGNTFADWIGGFDVGVLTGFNDDADGDGLDNGLENFLGTFPDAGNAGLLAGVVAGNTFTFTHPQNATPASDVSAPAYTWTTDLQTFHASGATAGGITVDLAATPDSPVAGTTTVTATVTGTVPSKLFVRLGVNQE